MLLQSSVKDRECLKNKKSNLHLQLDTIRANDRRKQDRKEGLI